MPRDKTTLTGDEVAAFLAEHPGWRLVGGQLERTTQWPTFLDGVAFVSEVAQCAEQADHHPDIDIRWRKVTLRLMTHDAGGLTFRDTGLAQRVEVLVAEREKRLRA